MGTDPLEINDKNRGRGRIFVNNARFPIDGDVAGMIQ